MAEGGWRQGLGDIAVALKRVLFHSLEAGRIASVSGEVVLPTGKEAEGLGQGVTIFEPFVTFGQALPADGFVQVQAGGEFPSRGDSEVFWRVAAGRTVSQGPNGFGRAWTPMVEVLAARDLTVRCDDPLGSAAGGAGHAEPPAAHHDQHGRPHPTQRPGGPVPTGGADLLSVGLVRRRTLRGVGMRRTLMVGMAATWALAVWLGPVSGVAQEPHGPVAPAGVPPDDLFQTSSDCLACHNGLTTPAGEDVPPMRPVTSQVAAEIGYDPAGGTDPGPFTQQVAERLHAADPRWGRRINSTGPISDDTVAYRVGTSPVNPLSIDIVRAAHTTHARLQWHTYDHWAETPGAHPTISRHISVYPGISRYISDPFFLFAGTKAAARELETTVTLGLVFGLASRQTEGFLRSLLTLLNLDNDVPDHSTISRRKARLGKVASYERRTVKPVHLLIDSSGLSVHVGQLRTPPKARDYRKLHLAVDEQTSDVVACELTSKRARDASRVASLVGQIERPIASAKADAAYDTGDVYKTLENHRAHRSPKGLIPPRKGAQLALDSAGTRQRNRNIRARSRVGKRKWYVASGYSRRSKVETTFHRYKAILGSAMRARGLASQRVEVRLGCKILNTMTALGIPDGEMIG